MSSTQRDIYMTNSWPEKALRSKTLRKETILPLAEDVGFASVFMWPNGACTSISHVCFGVSTSSTPETRMVTLFRWISPRMVYYLVPCVLPFRSNAVLYPFNRLSDVSHHSSQLETRENSTPRMDGGGEGWSGFLAYAMG